MNFFFQEKKTHKQPTDKKKLPVTCFSFLKKKDQKQTHT